MKYIIVAILTGAFAASCSPENGSGTPESVSVHSDTMLPNNSHFKPYEPDANYHAPVEVVSQYGPSGIIRDVVIDQNGIVWMAAWDGIISYDGKQFTNHTLKSGLSHHRVYSLMEDSKGNMWFGTMGAGAYKYDGKTFTNLSANNGMIDNVVFDLFEDLRGNIWFATTKGVSRYDGKSFLNLDSTDSLHGEVYALSEDKWRIMWFGGEKGLFRYNDTDLVEVRTDYNTSYMNVRDLYRDKDGTIWVAGARGLYYSTWDGNYVTPAEANSNFTGYVTGNKAGNLLLTTNGITLLDLGLFNSIRNVDPYKSVVQESNNLGIFGAREANDGTIWYGAMDGLHSVKDGKDVAYRKP